MPEITWKNVASQVDVNPYLSAIRNMQGSLSALADVGSNYIERRHQDDIRANEKLTQMNTDMVLNQMNQVQDFAQLQKAKASGAYDLMGLQALTGGAIDGKQFNQAYADWDKNVLGKVQTTDTAKDYDPATIELMNQYNQAMASGNVGEAQAIMGKIQASQASMRQMAANTLNAYQWDKNFKEQQLIDRRNYDRRVFENDRTYNTNEHWANADWSAKNAALENEHLKRQLALYGTKAEASAKMQELEASMQQQLDTAFNNDKELRGYKLHNIEEMKKAGASDEDIGLAVQENAATEQKIAERKTAIRNAVYGSNADWTSYKQKWADADAEYTANDESFKKAQAEHNKWYTRNGNGGSSSNTTNKKSPSYKSYKERYQKDADFARRIDTGLKHLQSKGLSREHALGILGNIAAENNFDPTYMFGSHTDSANAATNQGIISFQGSRRNQLMNHLGKNGHLNDDGTIKQTDEAFLSQLDFITDVEGKGSEKAGWTKFLNSKGTATELAQVFDNTFVRSKGADLKGQDKAIQAQRHEKYNAVADLFKDIDTNATTKEEAAKAKAAVAEVVQQNPTAPVEQVVAKAEKAVEQVKKQEAPQEQVPKQTSKPTPEPTVDNFIGSNGLVDTSKISALNTDVARSKNNAAINADLRGENKGAYRYSSQDNVNYLQGGFKELAQLGKGEISSSKLGAAAKQIIQITGIKPTDPSSAEAYDELGKAINNYQSTVQDFGVREKQRLLQQNIPNNEGTGAFTIESFDLPSKITLSTESGQPFDVSASSMYEEYFNPDKTPKSREDRQKVYKKYFGQDGTVDQWQMFDNIDRAIDATQNPFFVLNEWKKHELAQYKHQTKDYKAKEVPAGFAVDLDFTWGRTAEGNRWKHKLDSMRAITPEIVDTLVGANNEINADIKYLSQGQAVLDFASDAASKFKKEGGKLNIPSSYSKKYLQDNGLVDKQNHSADFQAKLEARATKAREIINNLPDTTLAMLEKRNATLTDEDIKWLDPQHTETVIPKKQLEEAVKFIRKHPSTKEAEEVTKALIERGMLVAK